MELRISLKDIASRAGVSAMTVSRALKNDPRVLAATRERILKTAAGMGYRPDPNLQQLMGYMRKVRLRPRNECIALIWPDMSPETSASHPHLRRMVQAAQARAAQFGFGLEELWLPDTVSSRKRIGAILRARGIQCLILAPLFKRAHAHLRLDWAAYSTVSMGLGLWRPQLHRVHFDHYGAMLIVMRKLAHKKQNRIALILDRLSNERMYRACLGAFLAHHPLGPAEASRLVLLIATSEFAAIPAFLKENRVDVLIESVGYYKTPPASNADLVTLYFSELHPDVPGIDQRDDLLGSHAVDMVVAQFHANDRGVPEHPKVQLCQGQWRDKNMVVLDA